nr:hypothetical protein Q903MT_gene962 [Picea sitchensis]
MSIRSVRMSLPRWGGEDRGEDYEPGRGYKLLISIRDNSISFLNSNLTGSADQPISRSATGSGCVLIVSLL